MPALQLFSEQMLLGGSHTEELLSSCCLWCSCSALNSPKVLHWHSDFMRKELQVLEVFSSGQTGMRAVMVAEVAVKCGSSSLL